MPSVALVHFTITAAHESCVMGKHTLRSLSLLSPKKDWCVWPHQSFFGYDIDCKIVLCCLHRFYSDVSVILKEGLMGLCPPILLLV